MSDREENIAEETPPLTGLSLISCAKANARASLATAARRAGYDESGDEFMQALQAACEEAGLDDISELQDLRTDQQQVKVTQGIEISPESSSNL